MWLQQLFNNIAGSGNSAGKNQGNIRKKSSKNRNYKQIKNIQTPAYVQPGTFNNSYKKNEKFLTAYHGTSSPANAASVFKQGWMIGSGNAYGDGIYFSQNLSEAKQYAGSGGVYLKCSIQMGKTCNWDSAMEKQYSDWCKSQDIRPDNSAKTSFLLKKGFNTLKSGNIIVVLEPQYANPTAWKRRNRNIRILSVHRADNDKKIRV